MELTTDTLAFTAPSRRGDLEILAYCMLSWLCGSLPWHHTLRNPTAVQDLKAKLLSNLPDSVVEWAAGKDGSYEIAMLMKEIHHLAYEAKPDYGALKRILSKSLPSSGTGHNFTLTSNPAIPKPRRLPMTSKATTSFKTTYSRRKNTGNSGDTNPPFIDLEEIEETNFQRAEVKLTKPTVFEKKEGRGKKRMDKKEEEEEMVQANLEEENVQWINREDLEETESQCLPPSRNPKLHVRSKNRRKVYIEKDYDMHSVGYYDPEHFSAPERKPQCCPGVRDGCHTYFEQDTGISERLWSYTHSADEEDEEATFIDRYHNSTIFQDIDHNSEFSRQYCSDLYKYGVAVTVLLLTIYIALHGL